MAKPRKTIPFDPAAHLAKSLKNPAFKAAYNAQEDEFSALDALFAGTKGSRAAANTRPHSPHCAAMPKRVGKN